MVTAHAAVFRDLWENQGQLRHVQPALPGLLVLPHTRRAQIARGRRDRAEQTTRSRVFAAAPWRADALHGRRRRGAHTGAVSWTRATATTTLATAPLRAPILLPPAGLSAAPSAAPGADAVATPVPAVTIPSETKARPRRQPPGDPGLRQAPECRARQAPCQTTMARALAWVEAALRSPGPGGVVVFAAGSLAEDGGPVVARRRQDGLRRLHTHRRRDTASGHLRAAQGWTRPRRLALAPSASPRLGASPWRSASPAWARSGSG